MRLSYRNDVVGLSAENAEEEAICALLVATDGTVFRLHASSARGIAFSLIGPEDDACRAPLNIVRSVEPRFAAISNLAHTPFRFDDQEYASVEGFWQGLKTADPVQRRMFAELSRAEAKGRGKSLGQPTEIEYGNLRLLAGSPEHWALMRRACKAKFSEHQGARAALIATGDRWLTHKTRRDSRTIPGVVMADIWMQIRSELRKIVGPAR